MDDDGKFKLEQVFHIMLVLSEEIIDNSISLA